MMTSTKRRIARLTSVFQECVTPLAHRQMLAQLSQMSREERHARMRALIEKLMRVRHIEPMEGESFADVAVRAVRTTQIRGSGWETTIRYIFREVTAQP